MADKPQVAPTKLEGNQGNKKNIEAKKYFVFNETGNIMMASTVDTDNEISEEVRKVFAEVSVFFAGMSRAMTTTINPKTGKPFSLYNYEALLHVIAGSGLFVHVTEEDVTHENHGYGADFSKELLEALLGLATGTGALGFASAMISSIGKEGLSISENGQTDESKVGNIVFVCEYLMGMPSVSAIVVYADMKKNEEAFQAGPCLKVHKRKVTLEMHKDTYMFVTPTFIHEYAGDMDSINSDPKYLEMVSWLSGLLLQTAEIFNVADAGNGYTSVPNGYSLVPGSTYTLQGQFLPTKEVPDEENHPNDKYSLKFSNGSGATFDAQVWSTDQIKFEVSGSQSDRSPIEVIFTKDGEEKTIAISNESFTVGQSNDEDQTGDTPTDDQQNPGDNN